MISVSPEVRVRLEGKVEALEWELGELGAAVKAAKARRFAGVEALLLRAPTTLRTFDDRGLFARLDTRARLVRQLERLVGARAQALGLPSASPSRLARWLEGEPVRYEHHRVAPIFLLQLPLLVGVCCVPAVMGWVISGRSVVGGLVGSALSLALVVTLVRAHGWSRVVLTARRLVLDDRVFALDEVHRIVAHVPFFGSRQQHVDVEVFFRDPRRAPARLRLSEFPRALRNELRMLDVELTETLRWF